MVYDDHGASSWSEEEEDGDAEETQDSEDDEEHEIEDDDDDSDYPEEIEDDDDDDDASYCTESSFRSHSTYSSTPGTHPAQLLQTPSPPPLPSLLAHSCAVHLAPISL